MSLHAAGESFSPHCRGHPVYAVALSAASEEELLRLEYKLRRDEIPHVSIREPDSPWNNQLMAIGIEPTDRDKIKRYTSGFPLVK